MTSFVVSMAMVALPLLFSAPSSFAVGAPSPEGKMRLRQAATPQRPDDLDVDGWGEEKGRSEEPPTICPAGGCPEEPEEPLICEMQEELERKRDEILCEPRPVQPEMMEARSSADGT